MRSRILKFSLLFISVFLGVVIFMISIPTLYERLEPALMNYLILNMNEEDKEKLYAKFKVDVPGIWDVVPEPNVARIGMKNVKFVYRKAPVQFNNAGMRSSRAYKKKSKGIFRIVCLGDSYVFGTGGLEKDRFCDQIEDFYREFNLNHDGKKIETLALGLPSWTLIQEATYLSSRISAYDPDIILMLVFRNDMNTIKGITGTGHTTLSFSPPDRIYGSGVFGSLEPRLFGLKRDGIMASDFSFSGREHWEVAMKKLKNLVGLQHKRGNKILIAFLDQYTGRWNPDYVEKHQIPTKGIFKKYLISNEVMAPFLETSYFPKKGGPNVLPHDMHPSRTGHRILRTHLIHAMSKLEWIKIPQNKLPKLNSKLSLHFKPQYDKGRLESARRRWLDRNLSDSLDFGDLTPNNVSSFLGGIFPEKRGRKSFDDFPWASVRCGFVLSKPEIHQNRNLEIKIKIKPKVELFPFSLNLFVNGVKASHFLFENPKPSGIYVLNFELPSSIKGDFVIEIILKTESYFTGISDSRMKSYQLISAGFVPGNKERN